MQTVKKLCLTAYDDSVGGEAVAKRSSDHAFRCLAIVMGFPARISGNLIQNHHENQGTAPRICSAGMRGTRNNLSYVIDTAKITSELALAKLTVAILKINIPAPT